MSRKPQNSASIQAKPTFISCTGKITVINPVVTSKGRLPKSVDTKFVPGTAKGTLESQGTRQRTEKAFPEPEDLEEDTLDTGVDGKTLREIIPTLPFTFQFNRDLNPEDWKDIDQALQLHQLLKDLFQWSMDNKRFRLASHWVELVASFQKICFKEIPFKNLMVITKGWNPTRNSSIPFRHQKISGQESPFFTIPGSFREKKRIQGQKQDIFQPKEERLRPNDPEAVGLGEKSTKKPEIALNTSKISSTNNSNVTPTQNEHSVFTPESNLNSDSLWLQMSQFAEKTQTKFAEVQESHERMKELTVSMERVVNFLQEGHAQLSKSSEETNRD
ncbi:hypothetical protein O181_040108 [Austropuccinia psidii MF-1]|uniref:Uncharacterized protein n=1 Tax=Austropuccinia psidii MF-1 TaxID=1389203 RepID=A0A9Q3HCJ7_9BASI|nr:hypothetical protein [Austropuccinia psidii MF-1]